MRERTFRREQMKPQYSTRGLREGWKRCRFCDQTLIQDQACPCSVKVTLRGDKEAIERAIGQLRVTLEIIDIDEEYGGGGVDSNELYLNLFVATPIIAVLPGKVQQ